MKYLTIRKVLGHHGYDLWIGSHFVGWAYRHDVLLWLQREIENETNSDLQTRTSVLTGSRIQGVG